MPEKFYINEYITVPDWVLDDRLDLSIREAFILSIIFGYSKNHQGAFWGSIDYLCKMTRSKSRKSVIDALAVLVEKGLVHKRVIYDPLKKCVYTAILPDWVSFNDEEPEENVGIKNTPSQYKNYTESVQNLHRDGIKITPNNTNEIREEKIKDNFSVFTDFYHSLCPNLPKIRKLTKARESALRARLREYSREDIEVVFRNAGKSDFLNGKNDRGWKADFDWLMNPNHFLKVLEGGYQGSQRMAGTCGTTREADRKFEDPTEIFG